MKTVQVSIRHGNHNTTNKYTGETVAEALAKDKSSYVPEEGTTGFDVVVKALEAEGKAARGWVDYTLEPEPVKFTARTVRHGPHDIGNGRTAHFNFDHDEEHGAPWIENDGHGVISGWERRDKHAGERIICGGRNYARFYDFAASMVIAKRDGWGVANPPEGATKGQIAALAVQADFDYCEGWLSGSWNYVCVNVWIEDADGKRIASDSLGGVENLNDYHFEQAAEMLNALVDQLNEQDANEPACHI